MTLKQKTSLNRSILYKDHIHHEPLIKTLANYIFKNNNIKENDFLLHSNYEMIVKFTCN